MSEILEKPWLQEHPLRNDPLEWAKFQRCFSQSVGDVIDLDQTHVWHKEKHPFYDQIREGIVFDPEELSNTPHMPIPCMELSEEDIQNLLSLRFLRPLGVKFGFDIKREMETNFSVHGSYQYLESLIQKIMSYDKCFNPFFSLQKAKLRIVEMDGLGSESETAESHTDFNYSPGIDGHINHRYLFSTALPTEYFVRAQKDRTKPGFGVSTSDVPVSGMPGVIYLQTNHQAHRGPCFEYPKGSDASRILVNVTFYANPEHCDSTSEGVVRYRKEIVESTR
jgi:hypothetical protein